MERLAKAIQGLGNINKTSRGVELAEVSSVDPLKVIYRGIELDRDNLKVADYLIKEYEREFEIQSDNTANLTGTKFSLKGTTLINDTTLGGLRPVANIPEAGVSNQVEMEGTLKAKGKIKWTDTLKKGDELAVLLTENEQTLIVLCKVVSI